MFAFNFLLILIFLEGLKFGRLVQGTLTDDLNDDETLPQNLNDHFERVVSHLEKIPTKVDFAALEARFHEKLKRLEAANDSNLNETCKFVVELQLEQAAILADIRSTSSRMSQNISAILTEFVSLKNKVDFETAKHSTKCGDDAGLADTRFRSKKLVCDNEWVIIQRRGTPTPRGKERTDFERIWEVYEIGFGSLDGDFWLGLETIHGLTLEGYTQLRVDLEDWEGNKKYAMYDVFRVADAQEKYNLTVDGYWGTAGDSLSYNDGKEFSTYENDNDNALGNCAAKWRGGWWHGNCSYAFLNSIYHNSSSVETPGLGVIWHDWQGAHYSLKKAEMKLRKPLRLI
ncbi:angiopoietin-related protein 7 [Folsomia candida]|uniref:angiopoietin-related protein 7 n=1 Tax=Folsomia candida TaxID=158441 RepID=UPI000B8FC59D|nr:angiopoietin-related protein 7 [Folsomia candida]